MPDDTTPLNEEEDFDSDTTDVPPYEDAKPMGWPAACAWIALFICVASCFHSCFGGR